MYKMMSLPTTPGCSVPSISNLIVSGTLNQARPVA